MEKFIYWIKRTLHHSKQCNSLCMLCKYYDECKIDTGIISGGNTYGNVRLESQRKK